MYHVLQRLRGISCFLCILSTQTEAQYRYQAEALELLEEELSSAIEKLEVMRKQDNPSQNQMENTP